MYNRRKNATKSPMNLRTSPTTSSMIKSKAMISNHYTGLWYHNLSYFLCLVHEKGLSSSRVKTNNFRRELILHIACTVGQFSQRIFWVMNMTGRQLNFFQMSLHYLWSLMVSEVFKRIIWLLKCTIFFYGFNNIMRKIGNQDNN